MIDLLDVNLWVALVDKRHVHHPMAQLYWSESGASKFAFCRTTMLGFLRLATSPRAINNPKTNLEAWVIYQKFLKLPNIEHLSEPSNLETHFQSLTTAGSLPHRLWTDANGTKIRDFKVENQL